MKKKFLLSMAIVFMLLNFTVFGASNIECNLSADQESKEVSVSVLVDGDKGGTAVTGIVFNDDGVAVFVAQGITDKNGKFEFEYINQDYNGIYTLSVAAPRKGLNKEMYFNMVTDDMKADIDATTKDAAGIESIINNYGIYMNIDFTAFNALSSSGQNAVYSTMASSGSIDFSSIKSITEGFYGAVVIETLKENGGKSSDYLAFLTDENYSVLTKDSIKGDSGNILFDELHADIQNAVLAKAAAKNYTSISELNSTFDFLVLEKSLEKALQWTEVHPIMLKYQQAGKLPGIDFNGYNQLKNQYVADGAMIGKEYSDYAQIVTDFNKAVALAKRQMESSINNITSSGGGGGTSFVMPSITLPQPVEKGADSGNGGGSGTVFSDMNDYMWANEAVSYLVEKGIISGVGDNMFAPSNGLTREQMSTILVRTRKIDVGTQKSTFSDVAKDRWSYPYVSAVYESGLMVGESNEYFGAESQITRNQYAVVMKRLIDLYGGKIAESPTIKDYADESSIPDWAIESVRYMKATGLMLGKTDNQFAGDEIITRAYACDVLYSVLTALNYDVEEQQ